MKGGKLRKLLFLFFLVRNVLRTNYFLSYWVFYVPVYIFTPELEKYLVAITVVLCAGMQFSHRIKVLKVPARLRGRL